MYISYLFSNDSEQAIIKDLNNLSITSLFPASDKEIELPKQPIGTWAVDILNADFSKLADILDSCKYLPDQLPPSAPPGFWLCDHSKLSEAVPVIREVLLSLHPLYGHVISGTRRKNSRAYDQELSDYWHNLTFEFAARLPNGELASVFNINAFKKFLDDLLEKPEYFTFDFLNFLNTSGRMRPHFIRPCTSYTPQAENNCNDSSEPSLEELYNDFLHGKNFAAAVYQYDMDGEAKLIPILIASILELTRHGKIIRKCANCGRYFIPENRKDTIYCSNQSPQDSTRSCKQYGSERLWYERQKDDEIATLSRNILSSKSMLAKRSNNYRPYIVSYDYFRSERLKWKKAVENGEKTKEEYKEWLLKMKSQKIIEEAVHGND